MLPLERDNMEEKKKLTQMGVLNCVAKTRIKDLGLKMIEKSVLVALCMHIYKDTSKSFWCNPSHDLIGSEVGAGKQSVSNAVAKLKKFGFVKVVEEKGTSNVYHINVPLILEKHNLWRKSFGKSVDNSPFDAHLVQIAVEKFSHVESKALDHKRNTSGLKNSAKPTFRKQLGGVWYSSESEYNEAVELEENCPF